MVVALAAAVCVASSHIGSATAAEAKVKTLLLVGGSIHNWRGIGDVVERELNKSDQFAVTRVNNDKDNITVLGNGIYKGKLMPALWGK